MSMEKTSKALISSTHSIIPCVSCWPALGGSRWLSSQIGMAASSTWVESQQSLVSLANFELRNPSLEADSSECAPEPGHRYCMAAYDKALVSATLPAETPVASEWPIRVSHVNCLSPPLNPVKTNSRTNDVGRHYVRVRDVLPGQGLGDMCAGLGSV